MDEGVNTIYTMTTIASPLSPLLSLSLSLCSKVATRVGWVTTQGETLRVAYGRDVCRTRYLANKTTWWIRHPRVDKRPRREQAGWSNRDEESQTTPREPLDACVVPPIEHAFAAWTSRRHREPHTIQLWDPLRTRPLRFFGQLGLLSWIIAGAGSTSAVLGLDLAGETG